MNFTRNSHQVSLFSLIGVTGVAKVFARGFDIARREKLQGSILNHVLSQWIGLVLVALAEVVWLAIPIEAPSTGFFSYNKGFPSIFVTSLAVVALLAWVYARERLLSIPTFQNLSHNPWPPILVHVGAFAAFFWLTILLMEGHGRPGKQMFRLPVVAD